MSSDDSTHRAITNDDEILGWIAKRIAESVYADLKVQDGGQGEKRSDVPAPPTKLTLPSD